MPTYRDESAASDENHLAGSATTAGTTWGYAGENGKGRLRRSLSDPAPKTTGRAPSFVREADRGGDGRLVAVAILVLAALLVAWTRIDGVDSSFWHDEVHSVLTYIRPGPDAILFGDYIPNNHVLFSLLSWATTNLLDDYSESAYRLWSTLPALAAVGASGAWLWRRLGPWTAVGFAALVLTSPLHLELARQARGYGLTFLAMALLLIAADRSVLKGGRWNWVAFAAVGVVGTYTLPVFVLPFLGVALAIVAARPDLWRQCAIAVVGAAVVLLVLYAPLLADVVAASDQQTGSQLPWHGMLSGPVGDLLGPNAEVLLRDAPQYWAKLLLAGLAMAGALRLAVTGRLYLGALLAVPVLFTYLVLTIGRLYYVPRFTSFLLLPLLALIATALATPFERLGGRSGVRAVAGLAAVVIAAVAVLGTIRIVEIANDRAELPIENFEQVAETVDGAGMRRVVTNSKRPEGLRYYVGRGRVEVLEGAALRRALCGDQAPFAFIDHPFGPEVGVKAPSTSGTDCLQKRGATLVEVPQQPDRGDTLNVWLVPRP